MQAIVDDISREVSIYFSEGTVFRDLVKNDIYELKSVDKEGVLLEHKPHFRAEQKNDLHIGYDELAFAYASNRFFISGFSSITSEGNKHDIEKLKRAIKDTRHQLELVEKENEKRKLEEDKMRFVLKRKTKRAVRQTRLEQEYLDRQEAERLREEKKQLEARLAKEEEERQAQLAKEESDRQAEIARQHKIKLLNKKKSSMQIRLRLYSKQSK